MFQEYINWTKPSHGCQRLASMTYFRGFYQSNPSLRPGSVCRYSEVSTEWNYRRFLDGGIGEEYAQ